MRRKIPVTRIGGAVLLVCFCLSASVVAKSRQRATTLDANYTSALAVANRFLQAWQVQDQEDGLLMLSDAAKQHLSEERLDTFFEHGTVAYEIERGKTFPGGRYAFPVVLFGLTEDGGRRLHPRISRIIVGRTSKEDWAVDRLP